MNLQRQRLTLPIYGNSKPAPLPALCPSLYHVIIEYLWITVRIGRFCLWKWQVSSDLSDVTSYLSPPCFLLVPQTCRRMYTLRPLCVLFLLVDSFSTTSSNDWLLPVIWFLAQTWPPQWGLCWAPFPNYLVLPKALITSHQNLYLNLKLPCWVLICLLKWQVHRNFLVIYYVKWINM